jgi:hypothetical protein
VNNELERKWEGSGCGLIIPAFARGLSWRTTIMIGSSIEPAVSKILIKKRIKQLTSYTSPRLASASEMCSNDQDVSSPYGTRRFITVFTKVCH